MSRFNAQPESLVFRIDEKLLQRRPPRLTVAGTLAALCKQVRCGDLEANFVVDILNENQLLPYMIGHIRNPLDLSLGRHTNASKVGDLIVSEECIRGTYELSIAFLEFVLTIVQDQDYKDSTKTMLASVTYIANEIYTSHHIWTYRNISDMNQILCLCTEIFHHIIANLREPTEDVNYSELESVCILSLSQNQAHKQLLDVIVDGKSSIKKKIEELNLDTEMALRDAPIVIAVRQSLFIFNKLLSHSKFVKSLCDSYTTNQSRQSPSQYQHGASSSAAPMTNLERALFDISIRPCLLRQLFSYIYQRNDSATACLSVDLIENIAKKFSMSLVACLGSEAEKVCEFFVECLSSKEKNIDLVLAILDLLSTCVKHQPGLTELFLNSKCDAPKADGTNATPAATPAGPNESPSSPKLYSLKVVMDLLKECTVRREDAHKLLHTYLVRFILTFWQKHHSAIEQFDKAEQFWESVADPLVRFLESEKASEDSEGAAKQTSNPEAHNTIQALTDRLNSYVLMILAREIFCLNSGISERKMNPSLSKIMSDMSQNNLLGKYSSYVRRKYTKIRDIIEKKDDQNRLLNAWRDMLSSYAKYKPFEISVDVQNQIIEDTLACMTFELRLDAQVDRERITAIGDILLLTWTRWMPKDGELKPSDEVYKSIHDLLHLADSSKELLPFTFLLTFQSSLNMYFVRHRAYLMDRPRCSSDLLVPAVQLMQFSLRVMEKYLRRTGQQAHYSLQQSSHMGAIGMNYNTTINTNDPVIRVEGGRANSNNNSNGNTNSDNNNKDFATDSSSGAGSNNGKPANGANNADRDRQTQAQLQSLGSMNMELNHQASIESRLCWASITTLRFILDVSRSDVCLWMSYLQTNLKTDSLVEFLSLLMSKRVGAEICLALVELLICLSSIRETADYLNKAALINQLNMIAVSTYELWLPIYLLIIRLNTSMALSLTTDYMTTAIEFLSIHCIRTCELLELLRTRPRSVNMEEALQLVYLINLVVRHRGMWKRRSKESYDAIADEIGKTAYTLATSALPPPMSSAEPLALENALVSLREWLSVIRSTINQSEQQEGH